MKEEQLLAYLKANCTGRKNIQTRAQLQRALNIGKDQLTNLVHRMRCNQALKESFKKRKTD